MKEWTSVINDENLKNPYWNIYYYTFNDERTNGFNVGKTDITVYNRYTNEEMNGKIIVRLAHQDIVNGKDADTEIKNHFKYDARFKFESKSYGKSGSDETFFPVAGHTVEEGIEEFERFFEKENTIRYSLSKEELDTIYEIDKKGINVGYICPRYHKTALILNLISKRNRNFNIMLSYTHTVKKSYLNDVKNYGLDIKVVDVDEISKDDLHNLIALGQKVLVVFFMTGTEDYTHKRRLSKLPNYKANIYIDEGDIGLVTDISKNKIYALCETIKLEKLFIASGTGLEKMTNVVKAFGEKPKELIRSYIQDVLIPRGDKATNICFIKFKNTYNLLEELFSDCVFENWNDDTIKNNRNSIENLLKMFFKQDDFFNSLQNSAVQKNDFAALQRVGNLKSFVEKHFNKDAASIIFVGNRNEIHEFIEDILKSIGVNAFIIDGNNTSGGDAEDYAKGILKAYPNAVFIATNMANRSFSVSKIKNEIILMNDPAEASYTQKVYRIATNDDVFKTGYIWDFTLGSTDDNMFGIIKPELDRGAELGLSSEKVLERILETKRVNFIFEALYNKEAFSEIPLEKLSSQLMMTTSFFDIKIDELAAIDDHKFISSCVGQTQSNNKKGKGDRDEKIIKIQAKGECPGGESVEETPADNRAIFKAIAKLILGSKMFFENFDRNNIPNSFDDIGFHKDDIVYVYDTLCNKLGETLIKSKLNDDYKIISKKDKNAVIAYNLRTFDYNNFSLIKNWASTLKKGDTVLAICLKSKSYIEYLKGLGVKVTVVEDTDFIKDAKVFKTLDELVNIIKDMYFDHIIMNPPYSRNLHLKILREAMKHSDDIVSLSPITEIKNVTEMTEDSRFIIQYIKSLEEVNPQEMNEKFNILIRKDCGIYHIDSSKKSNVLVNSLIAESIYKKTKNKDKVKSWRTSCIHRPTNKPFLYMQGDNGYAKGWHLTFEQTFTMNNANDNSARLEFDNENEKQNFLKTCDNKLFKYIVKLDGNSVVPAHLPFMPTYEHPWTDEDLYKFFDLTDDEIKEIDSTIC